jgi:xylan 1,4-beta-xylosidase
VECWLSLENEIQPERGDQSMKREIIHASSEMRLVSRFVLAAVFVAFSSATRVAMGQAETGARSDGPSFPVSIHVDATGMHGEMRPVWRFFGYDEPNYTYMKDGQKLLSQLSALSPSTVSIRTHNLLTSGDGRPALKWGSTGVYTEDDQGRPRYNWSILDRIFDTYKERGLRPYAQIGFMPEALSTHPKPYQHEWVPGGRKPLSTGWAYPPKDYKKWAELVFQWVTHCVERYGKTEVERWYWEVWNEPNIFYWRGTPEEYQKLYDFAVDAVKRALPTARVGGPHVAGPRSPGGAKFLREFLDHCLRGKNHATGKQGSPLDFVAFHAKGVPEFVDGHVRTGIAAQLQDIDRGFGIVASYLELRGKPIIIGESDPDGCAACPATIYPQNGYRNGTLFSSYTAAAFARKYLLADKHGVNFEGAVTWAFEFEDQPYFAGYRVLSTNGIALPVLNVFRMFGMMGGHRVNVTSSAEVGLESIRNQGVRAKPDVSALASIQDGRLCVLVWHFHEEDVAGPSAEVGLELSHLGGTGKPLLLQHFRIDKNHSNSYEAWKRLGSPAQPTRGQYEELERWSQLSLLGSPEWVRPRNGELTLRFSLPRQAVSLIVLDGAGKTK